MAKYQEFIERKLDSIIQGLQYALNDATLKPEKREEMKKWSLSDFEKAYEEIKATIHSTSASTNVTETSDYDLLPFDSYEELHKMFGGTKTGYDGESEWCHANGSSTYESWTSNGKYSFYVLAKKNWKEIVAPTPTNDAYDEYGTSLIAILVSNEDGELKNSTLRWNHIVDPSKTKQYATVDKAFLSWADLDKTVGMKVEDKVKI
jgi:hypothetical protein